MGIIDSIKGKLNQLSHIGQSIDPIQKAVSPFREVDKPPEKKAAPQEDNRGWGRDAGGNMVRMGPTVKVNDSIKQVK